MKRHHLLPITLAALVAALLWLAFAKWRDYDTAKRLEAMQAYLYRTGPCLCAYLDKWTREHNWPTWLCGPTSYAVAVELNRRFFGGELPIVGTYAGGDCIHVRTGIARAPAGGGKYIIMEHAWIEIHWRGLLIFVDPTYGQFDHLQSIVFAWFVVGKDDNKLLWFREMLRVGNAESPGVSNEIRGDVEWTTMHLDAGLPQRDWLVWTHKLRSECLEK